MNQPAAIKTLLEKHILNTASLQEQEQLFSALEQDNYDEEELLLMLDAMAVAETGHDELYNKERWQPIVQEIIQKGRLKPAPVVKKLGWIRYAAAAIIVLLGAGAYLFIVNKKEGQQPFTNSNRHLPTDIKPGGEKAMLTLADGTRIPLDSAANGNLATQGGAHIIKLTNGQIVYQVKEPAPGEVLMNTMSTPKGGQYQLTLPDGTKVWLNAASSITYPAVFVEKQRIVKITGEAYFEVAPSTSPKTGSRIPFIVDVAGKQTVEVLGTHFNINSYDNEDAIRTTLLEGKVKVVNRESSIVNREFAVLKPGEQADISYQSKKSHKIQVQTVDVNKVIAWKNGWFNFDGAGLYDVMRQLERWYDIDVTYEGNIPAITFKGKLDKGVPLSEILNIFSSLGYPIRARLEGRTLIISGIQH